MLYTLADSSRVLEIITIGIFMSINLSNSTLFQSQHLTVTTRKLVMPEKVDVNIDDLKIDEAFLSVTSPNTDSWLYALQCNCHKCPFSLLSEISVGEQVLTISTKHDLRFRVTNMNNGVLMPENDIMSVVCDFKWNLGQFGVYELKIDDEILGCETSTIKEPVNIYIPLIFMSSLLLTIGLLLKLIPIGIKWFKNRNATLNIAVLENRKTNKSNKKSNPRLASLDTFRGMSVLLMILVNDGIGDYAILDHATWDGLQLADAIFPCFVWIMGVCIPISIKSQLKKKIQRLRILVTVLRRSCILFLLGVMLSTRVVGPQLETLRIFGVLQRFGVLYLFAGGLCALCWPQEMKKGSGLWSLFSDLKVVWPQWAIHLCLHAIHLIVIFTVHAPDCPSGYLGPGGISEDGIYENCTGGATGYIDKLILGNDHLFQYPTTSEVYKTGPFDPEGPYGSLPSMLMVMLGVQAGATLLSFPSWKARTIRWAIWGVVCIAISAPLAATGAIPINKNLWSTSFTFAIGGLAFLLLTLCYFVVDVWRIWHGGPFIFPGMNATIMYVGHLVAMDLFPFHWSIGQMNSHAWSLFENLWGTAGWALVAFQLYRKKFFLSI